MLCKLNLHGLTTLNHVVFIWSNKQIKVMQKQLFCIPFLNRNLRISLSFFFFLFYSLFFPKPVLVYLVWMWHREWGSWWRILQSRTFWHSCIWMWQQIKDLWQGPTTGLPLVDLNILISRLLLISRKKKYNKIYFPISNIALIISFFHMALKSSVTIKYLS